MKRLTDVEVDAIARAILGGENRPSRGPASSGPSVRSRIIAANWKMNLGPVEARNYLHQLAGELPSTSSAIVIFPPAIYLDMARQILPGNVKIGAQNAFWERSGAFTGEISCQMLQSLGVSYLLVGHSERRMYFNECSDDIARKAQSALENGIKPVICFGETLEQRQGNYLQTLEKQVVDVLLALPDQEISRCILAYEPIWAIGTGITATPQMAQEVHSFIRALLAESFSRELAQRMPILYGGSVKANNARAILSEEDIDGALVGGASLNLTEFKQICL